MTASILKQDPNTKPMSKGRNLSQDKKHTCPESASGPGMQPFPTNPTPCTLFCRALSKRIHF